MMPSAKSLLFALVALSPAWGQVTITLATQKGVPVAPDAPKQVLSRLTCGFTAAHADGQPRAWHWMLEEPDGGRFVSRQGRARMAYQAPFVLAPRVVHVRVTDPANGESEVFALRVLPREGVAPTVQAGLTTMAQPNMFGPVADVPVLAGLAGRLPGAVEGKTDLFDFRRLKVVTDPDPAMKAFHGKCLIIAEKKLWRLDGPWSRTPIPLRGKVSPETSIVEADGFTDFSFTDVSVRPAGSSIGDRRRMVGVFQRQGAMKEETYICGIDPDGTVWPIVGSSQEAYRGFCPPSWEESKGAGFSHMTRTALDAAGNILAVEPDRIRRIDAEGRVTLLAGGGRWEDAAKDGVGAHASFNWIFDFTLDAESGDLFVSDWHAIRRVRPDGTVTTVLGVLNEAVPDLPTFPGPTRIAEGVPCLDLPKGLAHQGGVLYICHPRHQAILAFNLLDRTLHTLHAADGLRPIRLGCLPAFDRGKPLEACANLTMPDQIVMAGRRVFVAADGGFSFGPVIVQFDLPHGVYGETEGERKE